MSLCNPLTLILLIAKTSICTTGQALQAWALTTDALGRPNFKFAAETNFTLGCHGTPTVTTLNEVTAHPVQASSGCLTAVKDL